MGWEGSRKRGGVNLKRWKEVLADGTRFSWTNFWVKLHMAFLPVSAASLIESCSFWYGLKDLFPMHKLGIDSVLLDQKGTCMEIPTCSDQQFRDEWVDVLIGFCRN